MQGPSRSRVREVGEPGLSEAVFARLHPLMGWLGALFVLIVVGDAIVRDESPFATIFTVAGWAIWAIFVLEFLVRLSLAPSRARFMGRNWWQVVFLVLPFLAMLRFLFALRIVRAGRLVSAAVRGTRTAATGLRSRLARVGAVTAMLILLSANVLFEFGEVTPYSKALHSASLGTITGEPIATGNALADVVEVVLALYSVVVFAAVAGALGAYFLQKERERHT